MTGPEVNRLLGETRGRLGRRRPWGVGLLGFAPDELRQAQLEQILQVRPSHAIIAGGRPSQARKLEEHGIAAYLHVPSPGLLEAFIRDGARKFIFEGRECGGHVGPRSSLTLWQSAVDVLLRAEVQRPEDFHLVFAGGIHDRLSAAMVAAAAARLTARGMKIGVLMGTAYLFTQEAVTAGAILPEFQRQALACQETVQLESGVGHATRAVNTPFAEEFRQTRAELIRAGKDSDEVRRELERLNVGRLRIASKGLARTSDPHRPGAKGELVALSAEEQRRQGLYMIGQVAGLRQEVGSMAQLHADVSRGSRDVLAQASCPLIEHQGGPAATKPKTADIAIVGMAGMFPGAPDLRRYWQNICKRRSCPSGRKTPSPASWPTSSPPASPASWTCTGPTLPWTPPDGRRPGQPDQDRPGPETPSPAADPRHQQAQRPSRPGRQPVLLVYRAAPLGRGPGGPPAAGRRQRLRLRRHQLPRRARRVCR
jgi:NAD(P)H-dependent flavin oxidoreductase YrpB (nitropropane dioxygenase family)